MKFITTPGPYQRDERSTHRVMKDVLLALSVIWISAIGFNFTIHWTYGVKAILMVVVSVVTALLCDALVAAMTYKPEKGKLMPFIKKGIQENFSLVTAMILALSLPIGVPYYVLILGGIFATLLVKYAFGGFGANIFNPAAMGRIFLMLAFSGSLTAYLGTDPSLASTLTAGATVTSTYANLGGAVGLKWLTDSLNGTPINLFQLWLGSYSGAIGETFSLLIVWVGIFLVWRGAMNWRPPVFFIGTVALTSIVVALFAGLNPLDYMLIQLGAGGLMFGAVFMLTDPVTSPTSMFGKAVIGIVAGFMTVLIRIQGSLPEGVVFAIVITNAISPVIDKYAFAMTNKNLFKKWAVIGSLLVASFALNGTIAYAAVENPSSSSSSDSSTSSSQPSSSIVPIDPFMEFVGSYTSTVPAFGEPGTAEVVIQVDEDFEILDVALSGDYASDGYVSMWSAHEADILVYYETLSVKELKVLNPANITTLPDIYVSGATYTSERVLRALQDAVSNVDVYTGTATSDVPEAEETNQVFVDVYAIDGVIATIAVYGEARTGSWANVWNNGYENVREFYKGKTILYVQGLVALPGNATVTSATISSQRLFDAIQNALVGV